MGGAAGGMPAQAQAQPNSFLAQLLSMLKQGGGGQQQATGYNPFAGAQQIGQGSGQLIKSIAGLV
jgi:hypothetical protein